MLIFFVLHVHAKTLEDQPPDFLERNMMPCKQEDSIAEFCVKDIFHGLPVIKKVIPDPLPVVAFYIDLPLYNVEGTAWFQC